MCGVRPERNLPHGIRGCGGRIWKIGGDGILRLERLEPLSVATGGRKRLSERPQSAQEGSGGDGNLSAVRRKMLRTKRTMRTKGGGGPKAAGEAPENTRDMRGKGRVGETCAPSAP
jgi:hypothetical protein